MKYSVMVLGFTVLTLGGSDALGQMLLSGRVWTPRSPLVKDHFPPSTGLMEDYFGEGRRPLPEGVIGVPNVHCFASRSGGDSQSLAAMTWSTQPAGWFSLSGPAGDYTLLFTGLDTPTAPMIVTNVHLIPKDRLDLKIVPRFDYYVLEESAHDPKPAREYFQTFVAHGKSVTQISFRLEQDGIDGIGPASQTVLVSIHKKNDGAPDSWPQIGPSIPVLNVDAGGPKNYDWTAAWNSGEVPVTPGETYAVHLKPKSLDGKFQAFWRPDEKDEIPGDCYRIDSAGETGWQHCDLYMTVATDGDGLLIPYNKRVQKQFGPFAGFDRRWSQTYVAQGRGLAGVILYAATGGSQPGIHRQRVRIRVREGGPAGPQVGVDKIGVGTGIYTGDASWGTFGAVFAPGEVNLIAGRTFAIEVESIENYESLHGYVNIKGVVSDERPGFNPYRKIIPDSYEHGTAYQNGTDDVGFDLDMQIVEYEYAPKDWSHAVLSPNLLRNGDMESGELHADRPSEGRPEAWKRFEFISDSSPSSSPDGGFYQYLKEGPEYKNRMLRLAVSKENLSPLDAGYVQGVEHLSRALTYRLNGRVRCSCLLDAEHACFIGLDPTGQIRDPRAGTIQWTPLPVVHSIWTDFVSEPLRPAANAISIWLRASTKARKSEAPFKADFDDFSLQQVESGVPIHPG